MKEKAPVAPFLFFREPLQALENTTAGQEEDAILVIIVNFRSWHA